MEGAGGLPPGLVGRGPTQNPILSIRLGGYQSVCRGEDNGVQHPVLLPSPLDHKGGNQSNWDSLLGKSRGKPSGGAGPSKATPLLLINCGSSEYEFEERSFFF